MALRYDGAGTHYLITFPFLETAHIRVAVSPDGVADPVPLGPAEFSVVQNETSWSVITTTAYALPATVLVWRSVPLTQPTEFQLAGPFPSQSAETALDRVVMQIQQLNRRINEVAEQNDGDFVLPPPSGNVSTVIDVLSWPSDGGRGSAQPNRAGQLGVQRDNRSLWVSQSAAVGDWKRFGDWQKEWRIYQPTEELPAEAMLHLGTLSEPTSVKSLYFAIAATSAGSTVELSVFAGAELLGQAVIESNAFTASCPCLVPNEVIPDGTRLSVAIVNDGYGTGQHLGLDVILQCRYQ